MSALSLGCVKPHSLRECGLEKRQAPNDFSPRETIRGDCQATYSTPKHKTGIMPKSTILSNIFQTHCRVANSLRPRETLTDPFLRRIGFHTDPGEGERFDKSKKLGPFLSEEDRFPYRSGPREKVPQIQETVWYGNQTSGFIQTADNTGIHPAMPRVGAQLLYLS